MNSFGAGTETMSAGVLLIRIVTGLVMTAHGAQKLFGWFGGYGLGKTGDFFAQLGFRPGRPFAAAASFAEIVSGLLVAFGFLGPIGPALMVSVMIVAAVTVHWEHGLFASTNGIELPLLYSTTAGGLALIGFGRYSLDAWLGLADRWTPAEAWIALVVGVLGGVANLIVRRRSMTLPEVAHADRHR
jgi:putative oxidoreductase